MQTPFPTLKLSCLGCLNYRLITRSLAAQRSFYDVLQISAKAHQREVKAAYYKLSKAYHPDINATPEAATKFREITEAYEVLGNIRSRRLYDKGVVGSKLGSFTPKQQYEEHDRQSKFYRSREKMHKTPMTGRTAVFDFDAWSKNHYGDVFTRREKAKTRWTQENERMANRHTSADGSMMRHFLFIATLLVVALAAAKGMDYDDPREKRRA